MPTVGFGFAISGGDTDDDAGQAVATDDEGNVYLAGNFDGTIKLDSGSMAAELVAGDAFVAKYAPDGTFSWAFKLDHLHSISLVDVVVDTDGNVLVLGNLDGELDSVDFDLDQTYPDNRDIVNNVDTDLFVLKLNPSGQFDWVRRIGGSTPNENHYDIGYGIGVDGANNVYITGTFRFTTDFDPDPNSENALTSIGEDDLFVTKLQGNGDFVWARRIGGEFQDTVNDLAVDSAGNIYLTGFLNSEMDFEPGVFEDPPGSGNTYVCKLATDGSLHWVRALGGDDVTFSDDEGVAITVDDEGNVYTAGYFEATGDFDPGPDTFNLTSVGNEDVFISKLDVNGNFVWARALGSELGNTELDEILDIAVDGQGNVYTTGFFTGTGDFDPGPGSFDLTSLGNEDVFISKLDANGNFVWARAVGGPGEDSGHGIAVDGVGNVYTTGHFNGTVDLDPGPGQQNRVSAGEDDLFFLKLTTSAGFVQAIDAISEAQVTASDADGNIYVAGSFSGTADFDPGPDVFPLSAQGTDIFVASYTSGGNLLWAYRLGGAGDESVTGLVVGNNGEHYITGTFQQSVNFDPGNDVNVLQSVGTGNTVDVFVAKISGTRDLQWARRLGGAGNENANGLAVDAGGNVLVVGDFEDTVDFDPDTGIFNLTSVGFRDAFVWKLSAAGALVWARQAGGISGDETGTSVVTGSDLSVYVTGAFRGVTDFAFGPGVVDLVAAGETDIFVWKLTAAGNTTWARRAGGTGEDQGSAIALDPDGNVNVTGSFKGTADFDPGPGLFELISAGESDVFIWKLTDAGNRVWAHRLGGSASDVGNAIVADGTGVYVAGAFQGTVDFDPGSGVLELTSGGDSLDAFVVKLDSAGNRQWAHRLGGTSDDQAGGLTIDFQDRVSFVGSFIGVATFDPGDGEQSFGTAGLLSLFIARVNQSPLPNGNRLDAFEPNNSLPEATYLGVINEDEELVIDNLTLHTNKDEDWFRFDLLSPPGGDHRVRIDFLNSEGDLDLELYRPGEPPIKVSTADDFEQIFLTGYGAGIYHVRVFGSANPSYKLTLKVPQGVPPDNHEGNDTLETATDLGTLDEPSTISNLSIHVANNDDWFRFTTVSAGTFNSSVRIAFRHALGDLDMQLYDPDGKLLRQSAGASDIETISLAGLPAGVYVVRVFGHKEAFNPTYALMITPPRPLIADAFDSATPNDSRDTAAGLGEVLGTQEWGDLSIHNSLDQDWFQFRTVAVGRSGHFVAIDFEHVLGDLDLRLYDSAGNELDSSTTANDRERISLENIPGGIYYLQVVSFNGATQPSYHLSIVAPINVNADLDKDRLEGTGGNNTRTTASQVSNEGASTLSGVQSLVDLNLHTGTDQDWFRFTTTARSGLSHQLVLHYASANGNLDLELYTIVRRRFRRIRVAQGAGDNEVLSLNGLAAGTYYARVSSPQRVRNTYSLTFDTPTTLKKDDWTILVYMTADNLVDRAFEDINEMELAASQLPGSVNIAVLWDQSAALNTYATGNGSQRAWGGTGYALITPDTNPDQIATTFHGLNEQKTGHPNTLRNFVTWAKNAAPAEKYALILWDHGSGLHGFNFDKSDRQVADNLTTDELVTALTDPSMDQNEKPMDLIAFDACFMGLAEVAYSLRTVTPIVVAAQDAIPGDGFEYDKIFSVLRSNPAAVTAESLATNLIKAFADRYGSTGSDDTLSAVRTQEMENLTAKLRTLTELILDYGTDDPRLELLNSLAVATLLHNQSAGEQRDLGSFLGNIVSEAPLSDLNNAANEALDALDAALISRTSDLRGSSGLSVYLPVENKGGGRFGINSRAFSGYSSAFRDFAENSGWLAMLDKLNGKLGDRDNKDRYDVGKGNGARIDATDLKQQSGAGHTFKELSLHNENDEDWFRFEIIAEAGSTLQIHVRVGSAGGRLTAHLRDCTGQAPDLGMLTTPKTGTLELSPLPAGKGTYYLLFQRFDPEEPVPDYQFTIDAPSVGTDWAGGNSTPGKAYPLPRQTEPYPSLSLGAGEHDWFRFDTSKRDDPELHQLVVSVEGNNPVEAQLRDSRGVVVSMATGKGTLVLPYTVYGNAESYTLMVGNSGEVSVPYSFRFASGIEESGFPLDQFTRGGGELGDDWNTVGALRIEEGQVEMTGSGRALWQGFIAEDIGVQSRFELPARGNAVVAMLARASVDNGRLTAYEGRIVRVKNRLFAQLIRTINGRSAVLRSVRLGRLSKGVLVLQVQGQHVRLLLDGKTRAEFHDRIVLPAGLTGFWGTANTNFDDFLAAPIALALPLSHGSSDLGDAWQSLTKTGSFSVQELQGLQQQDGQRFVANRAAVAIYNPAWLADVAMQIDYSLQSGQSISLLARHSGSGRRRSYCEARLSNHMGTVTASLVRVLKGRARTLKFQEVSAMGKLRFEVQGNTLRLLVGEDMLQAEGLPLPLAGQVGISASVSQVGISASAGVSIDNLSVTEL